jgi:hypothetical protein
MELLHQRVGWLLPTPTLEWFDLPSVQATQADLHVILIEKNNPPLTPELQDKKIESKGFKDISITDFPVRGRRVTLTFRRRYWKVDGQPSYLKRDINLCAPGTQLQSEFASFLKGASPETRKLFSEYC